MLTLPRIPIIRQRAVGAVLEEQLAHKSTPTYDEIVLERARAVIALTSRLAAANVPKFTIDTTTDVVITSLHDVVEGVSRGLTATVSPLNAEQQEKLLAAKTLLRVVFPRGTGFVREDMSLEYVALRAIERDLAQPEAAEAVEALGLGYFVDHFKAHLGPYGVAVTAPDGGDLELASDAWHDAFVHLVAAVNLHGANDNDAHAQLLAPYEKELEAHRADQRAARKRTKKTAPNPA
jgi:hypothetical protein